MAPGGMSADHEAPPEPRQFSRSHLHLANNVIDRDLGAQIVAWYRDADAVRIQSRGEMAEERTVQRLPVAAVDENHEVALTARCKNVDGMPRARRVGDGAKALPLAPGLC